MPFAIARIVTIAIIGLSAPLWWTWAISNLIYGFFLLGGSPEHPSEIFAWSSILLPSSLLGLATGAVLFPLCPDFMFRGWALFWAALLLSTVIFGLATDMFPSGISQLFSSPGNIAFLLSSLIVPLSFSLRGRRG